MAALGTVCSSGHLTPQALEGKRHGPGMKPNPFRPWSWTVLQMLATGCCAPFPLQEANVSPGANG